MKPVAMFVLGAVLAGGAAFFIAGRGSEPKPVQQVTSEVTPQPVTPAPVAEPVPAPVEPVTESAKPSPFKESPRPAPKPVRRAEPREPKVIARNDPPPQAQPQPQKQEQTTPMVAPTSQPLPPPPAEQARVVQPEERKPEPRKPNVVTIPSGTMVTVRVDQTINSQDNQEGDTFRATLDAPLVIDGFVIAERGARAEGKVSSVEQSGRVRGLAQLGLVLTSLRTADGQTIKFDTESFTRQAESSRKNDAAKVGAAAGIGAAIGAIAGGGKGAAIGATVGGATGAGGVMATRGNPAEVRAETRLTFKLTGPVTVTEKLR